MIGLREEDAELSREHSRALPRGMYGDPADVIERAQMNQLGCRACSRSIEICGRSMCGERRNLGQKGFPAIGWKCRWFLEQRDRKK